MNAEIEQHADFKKSDFPDYKPHVTVAYVKPEAADKYVGMDTTDGKSFDVNSIQISDRNGNKESVPLTAPAALEPDIFDHIAGEPAINAAAAKPGAATPAKFAKGSAVQLPDGTKATVSYMSPQMNIVRVRTSDGRKLTVRQNQIKTPEETNDRNSKPVQTPTTAGSERYGRLKSAAKKGR